MSIDYVRLKDLLNGCTAGQWQSHDYEPDPYCYPGAIRFVIAADWDRVEIAEGQAGPSTKFPEYARKANDFALIALAPDMARELLRLHDGVEQLREMCLLVRDAALHETPASEGAANAFNTCAKQLTELLEGDRDT